MVTQFLSVVCAARRSYLHKYAELSKIPTVPAVLSCCPSKSSYEATNIITRSLGMLRDEDVLKKVYTFPRPLHWSDSMECHGESDVAHLVRTLLSYVLTALELNSELVIASEVSVFETRPNLLLLRKVLVAGHSIPIGVVEVKKPCTDLNNKMQGQLYDYLQMLKSSFNLNFAIGILTNFNQWQVLWLPGNNGDVIARQAVQIKHTSSSPPAASQPSHHHDIPKLDIAGGQNAADCDMAEVEDLLKCIRVCSGTDIVESGKEPKRVLSLIITTIYKMYQTKVLTTAEISSSKVYFLLTHDSRFWVTCPWKDTDTLNYDEMPSTNTNQFYLLKPLGKGIQGVVWLACSKSLKVCAIKFYHSSDRVTAEYETQMWKKLGFTKSRCIQLQKRVSLIMPYVKPCTYIIFNGFYEMAKETIEDLSKLNLCHQDIRIENMGYYFDRHTIRIALLDLGSIVKCETETACKTMLDKLNDAMKTLHNYPSTKDTPARGFETVRHS